MTKSQDKGQRPDKATPPAEIERLQAEYLARCEGSQIERKEILAWLRWEAEHRPKTARQRLLEAADAIEQGEHWRPR